MMLHIGNKFYIINWGSEYFDHLTHVSSLYTAGVRGEGPMGMYADVIRYF